jgi:hypothetical protein
MTKRLVLLALALQSVPALARDMIDEKGEYTPYGIAIAMIASAQMRCGKKGQIDLAIAKARNAGVPIDVNDKEDYIHRHRDLGKAEKGRRGCVVQEVGRPRKIAQGALIAAACDGDGGEGLPSAAATISRSWGGRSVKAPRSS